MPLDLTYIAIKLEGTPNTWATPTFANDGGLVYDYNPVPLEATELVRNIDRGFPGQNPAILASQFARHPFKIELSGGGAATTAPWWARVLRGALFGAPTVGASDVTLPLATSGDGDSLSLIGNKDNVRHRAFGIRGNVVFDFTEGALPFLDCNFIGQIQGGVPADAAAASGLVLPSYPAPVEVNDANTAILLDTFEVGVKSFRMDLGMAPVLYSTTGGRAIVFDRTADKDRRGVTFDLVAELPDPSVKSYFGDIPAQTPRAFSLTHGTAAGNIITLTSSVCVLRSITYSVVNNRLMMNCRGAFVPSSAGNDFTLKTA